MMPSAQTSFLSTEGEEHPSLTQALFRDSRPRSRHAHWQSDGDRPSSWPSTGAASSRLIKVSPVRSKTRPRGRMATPRWSVSCATSASMRRRSSTTHRCSRRRSTRSRSPLRRSAISAAPTATLARATSAGRQRTCLPTRRCARWTCFLKRRRRARASILPFLEASRWRIAPCCAAPQITRPASRRLAAFR